MKKTLLLALCAVLALCGCSSKSESSSKNESSSGSEIVESSQSASVDADLEELGTIVTSSGEWPSMYIPDDDEFTDYFGVSKNDEMFSQIYGSFCPMSAILTEVILVVPNAGSEQQVQDFLDGRKELLIEKYAYYPSDKELAENAIIGNVGGVYYLLCAQSAEQAESALEEALS